MKLGKSQREKEVKRVASVAAYNADGLLLFGKRSDSGKWTLPGGHLEPGEEPLDGARRELEEEAGLKGQDFVFLGRGLGGLKDDIIIYSYKCMVDGSPDGSGDPDEECDEWRWVEPLDIPTEISENLHSPKNITLRLLGLQDGEVEEPMAKADPYFVERNPYSGSPIKIPKLKTKARREWDKNYLQNLATAFAGGDMTRLRPVQIPTDQNLGSNMAVNKSRLNLYKRMLKAKDRLPPAVVRRNGQGWTLLDGNHRLEAHRQAGLPLMHAVEIIDPPLKKGLSGLALVGALATGGALKAPEAPQQPQPINQIAQAQGIPAWHPEGLIPDMYPIAHLESSWGQNLAHASNKKGEFHTAFGALGFKPVTAHEEYLKSKHMQTNYPGLEAPEKFLETFKGDPKFYNLLASAHFTRLKKRHGGPQQAAFAWRWGTGACANATPEQIDNDSYVQKYTHMNLHQKQGQPTVPNPLNKSEVHDPLEPLLAHDDPRERKMALRSKLVTPYHLRIALRDEDPEVREMAVGHPMMTSALIEEALRDPDVFTRQAALRRPDLQEHHLDIALWDPELQTQAALHPALTEEQRQKLVNAADTPEGLKTELLAKSIGFVTYPKLGQSSPQTGPMVREPEGHFLRGGKNIGMGNIGYVKYNATREPLPGEQRLMTASMLDQKNIGAQTVPGYKLSVKRGIPQGGGPFTGTFGHESQHSVFSALKQKYGKEAGYRIIAQTLSALNPKEHQVLRAITDWRIQNRYDPIKEPEERIAYLHNYLQDGLWRKSAHKHMRIHMDEAACQAAHSAAKGIFRKLRERASTLGPEHIGAAGIQKDEEQISSWVLRQSEPEVGYNVSEEMLGLTPKTDSYLEAARFLGHTEPDRLAFRQALLADHDLVSAALISVGLPLDADSRKAFRAVLKLLASQGIKKSEKTHEVQALMADGAEVADGVRRGFGQGNEQELHLGGKHSAGTLMVRDPETGQMYLLKPGSGGQSPARGAREEHANQSRREAAFWHVAEAWGLNQRLPRADLLLIDGKEVAALHMLPFDWRNLEKLKFKDPGLPHKALEKYRQTGELHKWAILDYVLGNPDRHGQNLMVGPQKEGYPVALIDHGSAFAGKDFDPANDRNSFIPYYLRAWKVDGWHDLDYEQRLRSMPAVSGDTERQLRDWFHGINGGDLEAVLFRYGIDPAPSLERLAKIKALLAEPNFSEAINRIWLAT